MIFDDVPVIGRIQPTPRAEVEALETRLGITLPAGYAEFITRFGEGTYCDLFDIHPPQRIERDYLLWRADWREHWFFTGVLSRTQSQQSYLIGSTVNGDQIVFYPPQPDTLFILPRSSDEVETVRADFSDLHHWGSPTPRLRVFATWHAQTTDYFGYTHFTLDQASCLEQTWAYWGEVLTAHQSDNEYERTSIFFIPAIGGRMQITWVKQSNSLDFRFDYDELAADLVHNFMAHLADRGLISHDQ